MRLKLQISKRKKFVAATILLSLGLLFSQYQSAEPRIASLLLFSFLSIFSLFIILYQDIKGTFWPPLFILPFFYTLAFGFFYFLLPERFLTRILLTSFFGLGLYALFMTINIYAVAGIRTIQLLKAAHTVGFLLTVVAHFFLTNLIFSLRLPLPFMPILIFLLSFLLILQVIWTVALEQTFKVQVLIFTLFLSLAIAEISLILNFWPVSPTVGALFLSGNFYTFVGLSQAWLEKRLFKNTLWEYIGVSIIVFLVLITRTNWGG